MLAHMEGLHEVAGVGVRAGEAVAAEEEEELAGGDPPHVERVVLAVAVALCEGGEYPVYSGVLCPQRVRGLPPRRQWVDGSAAAIDDQQITL